MRAGQSKDFTGRWVPSGIKKLLARHLTPVQFPTVDIEVSVDNTKEITRIILWLFGYLIDNYN